MKLSKIERRIRDSLKIGTLVNYVLISGPNKGESRPALVVRIWNEHSGEVPKNGCCNLQVFIDGTNDGAPEGHLQSWVTSVLHAPVKNDVLVEGTYHFPWEDGEYEY